MGISLLLQLQQPLPHALQTPQDLGGASWLGRKSYTQLRQEKGSERPAVAQGTTVSCRADLQERWGSKEKGGKFKAEPNAKLLSARW